MHALIIEIISRLSYLVLCYVFLSTMAYFTYGWQWEYVFALLSKANQSSDYNFCESIVWETSFQTLTDPLYTDPIKSENDHIQKIDPKTPPMQIRFPEHPTYQLGKSSTGSAHSTGNFNFLLGTNQADVTKVKPITHSSFCWNALWLTHVAYIFPMDPFVLPKTTFAIYALLLLAKACMHLQSFLSPGQMHGFFSVTVYWWCLFALYVGFTDGWLFLASAIAELAIEPIDCELKPHFR